MHGWDDQLRLWLCLCVCHWKENGLNCQQQTWSTYIQCLAVARHALTEEMSQDQTWRSCAAGGVSAINMIGLVCSCRWHVDLSITAVRVASCDAVESTATRTGNLIFISTVPRRAANAAVSLSLAASRRTSVVLSALVLFFAVCLVDVLVLFLSKMKNSPVDFWCWIYTVIV